MAGADVPAEVPASEPASEVENTGGKPTMEIKVYAPFKVYFEGIGYSLSAENATGPFDILPRHHNFLCMLVPGEIKIHSPNGEKVIKVHRALMHVKADRVVVFMDV